MVALFKLSQDFLRVLPVKLIFLIILEDPSFVKKPDRNIDRVEVWDISGV